MANMEDPPEMSPGARYLLRIARENDEHGAMSKNAALFVVLGFGQELLRVCRRRNLAPLFSLLEAEPPPQSFLAITAAILRQLSKRLEQYPRVASQTAKLPVFSDFNRHVFQGFAQALADLAWPERAARDFDGPSSETFLARISLHDPYTLWSSTLQHYIANILQDYFAALRVREEMPDLDMEVEANLRLQDARLLARYAAQIATGMGGDSDDPAIMLFALEQAINKMLEGEDEE